MSKQLTPSPPERLWPKTHEGGHRRQQKPSQSTKGGIGGKEEAKCNKVSNLNSLLVFFQPRRVTMFFFYRDVGGGKRVVVVGGGVEDETNCIFLLIPFPPHYSTNAKTTRDINNSCRTVRRV